MIWRRSTQKLPGRHADPVDQADAILWAEDLRIRALWLVDELDRRHAMPMCEDHAVEFMRFVCGWADRARPVLVEIAKSDG